VLLGAAVLLVWRIADLARVRSDFTSSISHELRTPLTQILMYAEMVEMNRTESVDERSKAIGIITRETHRLIHLVENILRFSRTEQSGVTLTPKRLEVRALLDEVVNAFRPIASAKDVVLVVTGESSIHVNADDDALRRIVLNFLDNAVKYGPERQCVVVSVEQHGAWVRVGVADRGPGVAADDRERIWKPFVRVAKGTGGGIGLAIVRDLVERHGGRSGVKAGAAGGATFYVELPVA
jgi:signal transduction histidine kinase